MKGFPPIVCRFDGNSENVAHICSNNVFLKINLKFTTAVDLSKALSRANYRLHSACVDLFLSCHLVGKRGEIQPKEGHFPFFSRQFFFEGANRLNIRSRAAEKDFLVLYAISKDTRRSLY